MQEGGEEHEMQAQDLIKRVAEYDEDLARDLQKFIGSRKLGLVYEESKPEYVRLWNKPVVEGDLVNILPPRGIAENLTDDADEHDVIWHVAQITDNKARLLKVESGELRDASLSDLVAVARFDQNIYCGLRETGRVERGGDKPYQIVINGESDSLDNEGRQTYVELRKLASAMSIWRTTLAVSGHLSLAWLTRNR